MSPTMTSTPPRRARARPGFASTATLLPQRMVLMNSQKPAPRSTTRVGRLDVALQHDAAEHLPHRGTRVLADVGEPVAIEILRLHGFMTSRHVYPGGIARFAPRSPLACLAEHAADGAIRRIELRRVGQQQARDARAHRRDALREVGRANGLREAVAKDAVAEHPVRASDPGARPAARRGTRETAPRPAARSADRPAADRTARRAGADRSASLARVEVRVLDEAVERHPRIVDVDPEAVGQRLAQLQDQAHHGDVLDAVDRRRSAATASGGSRRARIGSGAVDTPCRTGGAGRRS